MRTGNKLKSTNRFGGHHQYTTMEGHGRVAHILPSSDQLQLGATLYLYVAVPSQGYSEDEKI